MKKLLTIILCTAFAFSCNAQEKKSTDDVGKCIHITAEEFNKKIDNTNDKEWKYLGNKPAIVDFYADWCGPCKMIAPVLEEIATERSKDIVIYKVNVDEYPELANQFGITGIPALLYIPMKGDPELVTGFMKKEDIEKNIKNILKK